MIEAGKQKQTNKKIKTVVVVSVKRKILVVIFISKHANAMGTFYSKSKPEGTFDRYFKESAEM